MAYEDMLAGAGITAGFLSMIMAFFVFIVIIAIAIYIYTSLAYMTIGKKLNYKYPWLAWIPFANISMKLQMGGFHWAWVFLGLLPISGFIALLVVPILGIIIFILMLVFGWVPLYVLLIISHWRIFKKRNYPPALSLIQIGMIIPYLSFLFSIGHYVVLGLVAWNDLKK